MAILGSSEVLRYLEKKYKWYLEADPTEIYNTMESYQYETGDIIIARADLIHAGPGKKEGRRHLMFCLLSLKNHTKRKIG